MQVVMNAHQNDFCMIWQYWFAVAGVISVFWDCMHHMTKIMKSKGKD